jgi:hypothetical protein
MSQGTRTAFLRQVEPLLPYIPLEHEASEASQSLSSASQLLSFASARLAWARREGLGSQIPYWEQRVNEERARWLSWLREKTQPTQALNARRRRTPAEALALVDPLPPSTPPAEVPYSPPSLPPSPLLQPDHHRRLRQCLRLRLRQQHKGEEEDGAAAGHPLWHDIDALALSLSFLRYDRGPKALAATCRQGREAFQQALTHARVRHHNFTVPVPPVKDCPRLCHLQVLDGHAPPGLPWLRQTLWPVAHRLLSLRLFVEQRALVGIFLQVDWPSLQSLILESKPPLPHMAAHPRMQGGHTLFPRLRAFSFPHYNNEAGLLDFAAMAQRGCFPALYTLSDTSDPPTASILLRASAAINGAARSILAHVPGTEQLRACAALWHSQDFFQILASAVPTRLKHLRCVTTEGNYTKHFKLAHILTRLIHHPTRVPPTST